VRSAPGPAAGFGFQFERALYWLAKGPPEAQVGIETDDDVSATLAQDHSVREQAKHSIKKSGHPFADTSEGLWNTLHIWLTTIHTKQADPLTTEFHLVTNRPVPDCLARRIAQATSADEAVQCLVSLKATAAKVPDGVKSLAKSVLSFDDATILALFNNVHLRDDSDGVAGAMVRDQIAAEFHFPSHILSPRPVMDELLGLIVNEALDLWRAGKPAWITRAAVDQRFHAILERQKRERRRERSLALLATPDPETVGAHRGRIFVRQLDLLDFEEEDFDQAIQDALHASSERLRLSTEGDITLPDWQGFDERLRERWRRIRRARMREGGERIPRVDLGARIYRDTVEQHRERLAGADTDEIYLTTGSYHQLADSIDESAVGWHPDFRTLLGKAK
jgi:hypothetical protein